MHEIHRVVDIAVAVAVAVGDVAGSTTGGGKAQVQVWNGFHDRNDKVALSEFMIAFTPTESSPEPEGGGTGYTWNKSKGTVGLQKVHISLPKI